MDKTGPQPRSAVEDPLSYLPCSRIREYKRGEVIYSQDEALRSLHLVISGRVKVSRLTNYGRPVIVDIYGPDEFFGESAFVGAPTAGEMAIALRNAKVMKWSAAEIEEISVKRPKLALALTQIMAQRSVDLTERIENFAVNTLDVRVAWALLRFSSRFGERSEGGWVYMSTLTHELLAQYIGTSREIVTSQISEFRRQGYLLHSRKEIGIDKKALSHWLKGKR